MPYQHPTDRELDESTNRVMAWGVFLLLAMALAFPLYRVWEPAARADARELHVESLENLGGELYQLNCSSCHGVDGEGDTAPALNSQQFLQAAADDQTRNLVAVGVPGTQMSAYSQDFGGGLTSEQIKAISLFIRSWEEDAPDVPDWREPNS